jgi:glutaredoxin 3
MSNGDEIQATLLQITGQRTVPNVFVNGQHLGGNDDTQKAAASGRLQEMLAK